jgi:hypothetical protein
MPSVGLFVYRSGRSPDWIKSKSACGEEGSRVGAAKRCLGQALFDCALVKEHERNERDDPGIDQN